MRKSQAGFVIGCLSGSARTAAQPITTRLFIGTPPIPSRAVRS